MGLPETFPEPRVPTNVVDVDVRDQHKIDILRLNACRRQTIQIRSFQVIEIESVGPLLVVARCPLPVAASMSVIRPGSLIGQE